MINYTLSPNLLSRQWEITLSFIKNNELPTEISLPNWVPGSSHVISLKSGLFAMAFRPS